MKTVKELLDDIEVEYKKQKDSIMKYNLLHELEEGIKKLRKNKEQK